MSTRALQFDILLLGFRDPDTDSVLSNGTVNFLSAGTSDPLTVWDTKEKTGACTSVPLDDNGQAQSYGDGVYKLEVLDSTGTPVSYSPIDNVKIRAVSTNVVETNTTYTATTDDDLILCDTSGGTVLINLYPAAEFIAGLTIKNISLAGNDVTVDPDGAELIDGAATQALVDGQANEFFSNGSAWFGNGVSTGTNFTSTSLVFGDGFQENTAVGVTTVDVVDVYSTDGTQVFDGGTDGTDATFTGVASESTKVGVLNVKVIDIGDWNMDTTPDVVVSIEPVDFKKIRSLMTIIRNDDDDDYIDLMFSDAGTPGTGSHGMNSFSSVNNSVRLHRPAGGFFDQVNYDSTSYNRGWVTIWYID